MESSTNSEYAYNSKIAKCYIDPKKRLVEGKPVYLLDFISDSTQWDQAKTQEIFKEYATSVKCGSDQGGIVFPIFDFKDADVKIEIMPFLKAGLIDIQKHLGTQLVINPSGPIKALMDIVQKITKFKKYQMVDLGSISFEEAAKKRDENIESIITSDKKP